MLKEVREDETFVILSGATPVARLSAIVPPTTQRPKVGTRTSLPVRYDADAFEPLTDDQLEEW